MLGIKQESLAFDLGDEWNQKKVSLLEQKQVIDDQLLEKISEVLKIPVEAFQNFDEEQAVNIILNTINNSDNAVMHSLYIKYAEINPIEKILQFHDEKIALYERMLKDKEEMMLRMEKLLENK